MSFLNALFGCTHKKMSFPITVRGARRRSTEAAAATGTYVVCLDCGQEFAYDWSQMKVVRGTQGPSRQPAVAAEPRRVA
jgi:hypothetical protein